MRELPGNVLCRTRAGRGQSHEGWALATSRALAATTYSIAN